MNISNFDSIKFKIPIMNKRKLLRALLLVLFMAIFMIFINSCNNKSVDTATIKSADLAKELPEGKFEKVGSTFHSNDGPLHLFVIVAYSDTTNSGSDSTRVKASWNVMEANNEKNVLINENEFFAVAVENFFEGPEHLNSELPELYAILRGMLNQDPLTQTSYVQ